jgi:hypothetical protein
VVVSGLTATHGVSDTIAAIRITEATKRETKRSTEGTRKEITSNRREKTTGLSLVYWHLS